MSRIHKAGSGKRLAAGLIALGLSAHASADYKVELFAGKTPFNNRNVQITALGIQVSMPESEWVDGLELRVGSYEGPWNWSNTTWYSLGAYWQFWQQSHSHFEFSFSPTYLEHQYLAGHLVGGNWHFTSSLSYHYALWDSGWEAGARYLHSSNGGSDHPNPGIDGLGLTLSYRW